MGRVVGFEPTHNGTTIRGLNHLTTPAISSLAIYSASPSIPNQNYKARGANRRPAPLNNYICNPS